MVSRIRLKPAKESIQLSSDKIFYFLPKIVFRFRIQFCLLCTAPQLFQIHHMSPRKCHPVRRAPMESLSKGAIEGLEGAWIHTYIFRVFILSKSAKISLKTGTAGRAARMLIFIPLILSFTDRSRSAGHWRLTRMFSKPHLWCNSKLQTAPWVKTSHTGFFRKSSSTILLFLNAALLNFSLNTITF